MKKQCVKGVAGVWVMVLTAVMAFIWPVMHVTAANKYWDDGGSDDLWSNRTNWNSNIAPSNGDVLEVTAPAAGTVIIYQ